MPDFEDRRHEIAMSVTFMRAFVSSANRKS